MAAYDKLLILDKLLKLGWSESTVPGKSWQVVPPDSLWKERPASFHVYDAQTLVNLLVVNECPACLGSGVDTENMTAVEYKTCRKCDGAGVLDPFAEEK